MTAHRKSPDPRLRRLLGRWRRGTARGARRVGRSLQFEYAGRFGPLPTPEKWVFLVGCYNSGTTLLHDILAAHPQVGSMPDEGQFFTDQLPVPRQEGLRRLWALNPARFCLDERGKNDVDVDRLKRQWGARFNDPGRPVLLEKTPANAARTRWLQTHFAPAYFIGIIRDGRAVAEGIRRKTGHDIRLAARQWARSNEIMLRDFQHLERARLITYEQLTAAPVEVVEEIFSFLGLGPASGGLRERTWRIHEQQSAIRNMNDRSIDALTALDLEIILDEASPMLTRFGYHATAGSVAGAR